MKLHKKSIILILLLSFWVGYTALSLAHTIYVTWQSYDQVILNKKVNVKYILEATQTFLLQDNPELVNEHLTKAIDLKIINYFCLKQDGKILYENSLNQNFEAVCAKIDTSEYSVFSTFYQAGNSVLYPMDIQPYRLVAGFNVNIMSYLYEQQKGNIFVFLKDIILITAFLSILAFLVLKDFLTLDRLIQRGQLDDLSKVKVGSREAQTLLASTQTMRAIQKEDKVHLSVLQNTVGEALVSEIVKKTPHLQSIPCSLVRIDLNGYTQIFLEKKEEHIVTVMNQYFKITNELIQRHEGEIYQIIGDEIIFVFKNKSIWNAIMCVRSIFEWAVDLDKQIEKEHGHRFLLKASISRGHLKFVNLNTGYAFAGLPLIESVRLLGCVSDKQFNSLVINANEVKNSMHVFQIESSKIVSLKGFEETTEVVELRKFETLDFVYQKFKNSQDNERIPPELLSQFRSQNDLIQSLKIWEEHLINGEFEESFAILQHLKGITLSREIPGLAANLFRVLSDHRNLILNQISQYHFLNATPLLIRALVTPEEWTSQWSALLNEYLSSSHPRIVANALEVFIGFTNDSQPIRAIAQEWKHHNRISGNFLLAELKKEIKRDQVKLVLQWLESENALFRATGLFVIEETLKFYSVQNPVTYKTNLELLQFKMALRNTINSSDGMVQNRLSMAQNVLNEIENKLVS